MCIINIAIIQSGVKIFIFHIHHAKLVAYNAKQVHKHLSSIKTKSTPHYQPYKHYKTLHIKLLSYNTTISTPVSCKSVLQMWKRIISELFKYITSKTAKSTERSNKHNINKLMPFYRLNNIVGIRKECKMISAKMSSSITASSLYNNQQSMVTSIEQTEQFNTIRYEQ